MTEQNSKGIALVILGIVAIIAIVGLVLLFTGAKKSTGEFVVPVAKEYGGEIKGVASPYDRAFVGRSADFVSGVSGTSYDTGTGKISAIGGSNVGGAQYAAYGDYMGEATESQKITSPRYDASNPTGQTTCEGITKILAQRGYPEVAGYNQPLSQKRLTEFGSDYVLVSKLKTMWYSTQDYALGNTWIDNNPMAPGIWACGRSTSLNPTGTSEPTW